jgi:hypothetical protein
VPIFQGGDYSFVFLAGNPSSVRLELGLPPLFEFDEQTNQIATGLWRFDLF